ncbi:MAG: hypothetical protein IMY75_09965, partial [Chloroflexi bacterium]|nr:hypothetical protein [Chloroflexota bacterium]
MNEAEFDARQLHYWSHIRDALKRGNLVEAAEWLESAGSKEGREMILALKERTGA